MESVFWYKYLYYICTQVKQLETKENMENLTLKQQKPIFWKGNICQFIEWDTLNFGGKLKAKINNKFIEVDINELTN